DGREKPEVVAVAKDVYTTDLNNSFGSKTGTSIAAPQVAGMAALLMSRNNALTYWPEAVKAIIMASAVHNVDGGAALVSDKDGVGSVNMLLGDTIVQNGWWVGDSIATSTSEKNYYISVNAGERVRVVLNYLSHTSNAAPYNIDQIKSNLDLQVYTAGNQQIRISTRTADNWEIVEFTAPDTGSYRIRVYRGPSNTNDNESFAVAWSRMGTYLPDIRSQNSWSSTVYVRNDDSQATIATVTFLNSNGTVNGLPLGQNIAASGVYQFTPPANWSGSAVVDGNEDLSVVVSQERSGTYTHEAYPGVGNPATSVRVPIFQKNNSGFFSDLFVQNAGGIDIKVDLEFFASTGISRTCPDFRNITVKPGAAFKIPASDLTSGNSCDVGTTFVGSVQVSNSENQPLAIASTQYNVSGGVSQLLETSNTQLPATTLYAPLVQNNNSSYFSGFALSRTAAGSFDIRYYNKDTGVVCLNQFTLTNNPQIIHPAPPIGNPCPTVILAKVDSLSPMVGNVNQLKTGVGATTYAAITNPSRIAIIAKVRADSGWSDGFVIANYNSVTANVTVQLYNANGTFNSTPINNQALNANRSLIVHGTLPANFNGSAVITANQPVAVIANSSYSGAGDILGSYPANHR
ncbi:MAG: S8 family serine peptidase, partial [Caldilineaceae bacterium]